MRRTEFCDMVLIFLRLHDSRCWRLVEYAKSVMKNFAFGRECYGHVRHELGLRMSLCLMSSVGPPNE